MSEQHRAQLRDLVARLHLSERRCRELEEIVRKAPSPELVEGLRADARRARQELGEARNRITRLEQKVARLEEKLVAERRRTAVWQERAERSDWAAYRTDRKRKVAA